MSVVCQINCVDKKETEKKHSLRNEKLKANRTSETEEQRKERLRIRTIIIPNNLSYNINCIILI